MLRSKVVGTVVGLVVAMATIALLEWLGRRFFPAPAGIDMTDPAQITAAIDRLSTGLKASVVFAWFGGAFAGGWAGLAVARWRLLPWIVAAGVVLAAIANFLAIPHPL